MTSLWGKVLRLQTFSTQPHPPASHSWCGGSHEQSHPPVKTCKAFNFQRFHRWVCTLMWWDHLNPRIWGSQPRTSGRRQRHYGACQSSACHGKVRQCMYYRKHLLDVDWKWLNYLMTMIMTTIMIMVVQWHMIRITKVEWTLNQEGLDQDPLFNTRHKNEWNCNRHIWDYLSVLVDFLKQIEFLFRYVEILWECLIFAERLYNKMDSTCYTLRCVWL